MISASMAMAVPAFSCSPVGLIHALSNGCLVVALIVPEECVLCDDDYKE
jgi:hypothetical protein